MEIFVFGNIQDWGDSRLTISIFGAIWGHMVPLGPYGAVGAVGAVGPNGSVVQLPENVIFIPARNGTKYEVHAIFKVNTPYFGFWKPNICAYVYNFESF